MTNHKNFSPSNITKSQFYSASDENKAAESDFPSGKDTIFANNLAPVSPFAFNEEVTAVFDDMIKRSVPLYMESIQRQCQMAQRFYKPGTFMYDLGCSHGNLGIMMMNFFSGINNGLYPRPSMQNSHPFTMIAVDSSFPMIAKYKNRLHKGGYSNKKSDNKICLVCSLAEDIVISRASAVIVNLTMQFIKLSKRDQFIKGIHDGMVPGGILILSEKISHEDRDICGLQQDFYKNFKLDNGYSELEISRKREALENILIPETTKSHMERLGRAGFKKIDIWLKWFNFVSFIAIR
ncbi:carboxy-S-adenosyl-L-methionine synthase CmoA [Desulfamplus magnetovallimortis]|nr:carboxy-S-adenosyl-L-methionine synthase CmoA [Desulfamplus magnetovallimortis]